MEREGTGGPAGGETRETGVFLFASHGHCSRERGKGRQIFTITNFNLHSIKVEYLFSKQSCICNYMLYIGIHKPVEM
jgi:hypothetical protein